MQNHFVLNDLKKKKKVTECAEQEENEKSKDNEISIYTILKIEFVARELDVVAHCATCFHDSTVVIFLFVFRRFWAILL